MGSKGIKRAMLSMIGMFLVLAAVIGQEEAGHRDGRADGGVGAGIGHG